MFQSITGGLDGLDEVQRQAVERLSLWGYSLEDGWAALQV